MDDLPTAVGKLDDSIKRLVELVDLRVLPAVLSLVGPSSGAVPGHVPTPTAPTASGGPVDLVSGILRVIALAEISNDLQRATHAIMMGAPPPAAGAPGTSGSGSGRAGSGRSPADAGGGSEPASSHFGKLGRAYSGAKRAVKRTVDYVRAGASRGRSIGSAAGRLFGGGGRAAGAAGAAEGGAAGAMGAAGAVAGGVVGGIVAVGVAAYEAGKAIIKWTDEAMASAAQLAASSGSMAQVMAEREVKNIQRDQMRGESTAGSTRELMEAEARRKDAMAPLENAIDNATNTILTAGNNLITPVLTKINDGVELLKTVPGIGKLIKEATESKPAGEGGPLNQEMARMMKELGLRDDATRRMLDDAERAVAARIGGVAAPDGALRPGGGLGGL